MRRFELIEGTASKFWEVSVAGSELTVRFGRIGTAGQAKTKDFGDEAAAIKERDKLVKEKTGKGYTEAGAAGADAQAQPAASAAAAPAAAKPVPSPAAAAPPEPVPVPMPSGETADIEWPQGGFQWTDEWRAKLPVVRGIHVVPLPDVTALLGSPIVFGGTLNHYHVQRLHDLGASAGRSWSPWPFEACPQRIAREALQSGDHEYWLELCGQTMYLPQKVGLGPWAGARYGVHAGLLWLTEVGCALRGVPFMIDLALELLRIDPGYSSGYTVIHTMLPRLRMWIAAADQARHDAIVEHLSTALKNTDEHDVLRAYLCPHKSEWVEACVQRAVPDPWDMLKDGVMSLPLLTGYLKSRYLGGASLQSALLLQVHLHGEDAFELLAQALRAVESKERREDVLALVLAMHTPRLPGLLVELFERPEVRAPLEQLTAQYPAAMQQTLIERAVRSRSRPLQGWAVRLVLKDPRAWVQAAKALSPQDKAAFDVILDGLGGQEATPAQLPDVLRSPPWLDKQRAAELPTLDIAPAPHPDSLQWSPEEQQKWAAYSAQEWTRKRHAGGPPQVLSELCIVPEAQDRVMAGEWLQAGDVKPGDRFYGAYLDVLMLLPERAALAVWNSYPAQHWSSWGGSEVVLATLAKHGPAAIPGLVRYVQAYGETGLGLAMQVDSAALVPTAMHALRNLKKAKTVAMQWLLAHKDAAMSVALPAAFCKDKALRDNAQFTVRWLCANGHLDAVRAHAAAQGQGLPEALQALLDADPLRVLPSRMPKLPLFFAAVGFRRPVLKEGNAALTVAAMEHIGTMLAISKLEAPYAGIELVREACSRSSLAEFAWDVFEAWLLAGAPSKEGWAFTALGLLGDDETARRLAPRIREWPGESQHQRAVTGLDVLASIGSDAALMYLNGIASKVKFKGLQEKAREKIAAVAEARGLSAVELADRLVPDLGLDDNGGLDLDFGPRQFRVAFDEGLKPYVKDAQGARLKDLPKPNKADDEAKAQAAAERYKQLKKDAKAIASVQIVRLEQAMVQQRRWPASDFKLFFIAHPLSRHLAARLVWGIYDDEGRLQSAFRVAEDWTLADAQDESFSLPESATVGIAHVLEMPAGLMADFGQVFADYEILQPFRQLGRETHALTDDELKANEVKRFADKVVSSGSILGLINRGWERGQAQDAGWVGWFTRNLDEDTEVALMLEPGLIVGDPTWEPRQKVDAIVVRQRSRWGDGESRPLSSLSPIAASEVLRDADLLAPLKD